MAPHIANFLLGSFGIVAAVLLIGGSIVLRWQRNRQHHDLMRRSLETGTPLPPGPPLWVASQRQAWSILALGVGLAIVGCGAWWLGTGTSMPVIADSDQSIVTTQPSQSLAVDLDRRAPRPPAPNPAMEQWHSAQERIAIGQTALGCGIILTLLGAVRLSYSATERRLAAPQEL